MSNYILSADLDIQSGALSQRMTFTNGLNLISGENGTFKTKALQAIKAGAQLVLRDPGAPCRRQAVSPKRNAQRRAFAQVFEQNRRNNLKLEGLINERNINDAGFEDYPALGDLFYVVYDDHCKDGGRQIDKMEQTAIEFNAVIRQVFPHYQLIAIWNEATGSPAIELLKHGLVRVPLEGLSLGEQEILSLAINIYSSRDRYDVFLVDEPEVHLNWHLEEKLFEFLDGYCNQFDRQMIVVTHSRVVFTRRFYPKTQFFYWGDQGRVSVGREVSDEQRRRIAGDAIEVIQVGKLGRPTFFVEDWHHAVVIEELASVLGAHVGVTECDNKANVRSLYRLAKTEAGWDGSYFLEDGDNEGSPYQGDPVFIHLDKYCIENYLLAVPVVAVICSVSEDQVRSWLLDAIRSCRDAIFKRNKFFEFLLDHLESGHLTDANLAKLDAGEIMDIFLSHLMMDFRTFVKALVAECASRKSLADVFPSQLVEVLEELAASTAPTAASGDVA